MHSRAASLHCMALCFLLFHVNQRLPAEAISGLLCSAASLSLGRTLVLRKIFAVAGAKIWNSLSAHLRSHAQSLQTFGEKLKRYLFICHERICFFFNFRAKQMFSLLGCNECMRCRLLLPIIAVSVCQSVCHVAQLVSLCKNG